MPKRRDPDPLLPIDVPTGKPLGPGPVYQGVSKTLRARIADGTIDRELHAGPAAAMRSLAASIDRASGHNPQRATASGMQLAALHAQLIAWHEAMFTDGATDDDPLTALVNQWAASETVSDDHTAPPAHPA